MRRIRRPGSLIMAVAHQAAAERLTLSAHQAVLILCHLSSEGVFCRLPHRTQCAWDGAAATSTAAAQGSDMAAMAVAGRGNFKTDATRPTEHVCCLMCLVPVTTSSMC
jgi:hypothetical protein